MAVVKSSAGGASSSVANRRWVGSIWLFVAAVLFGAPASAQMNSAFFVTRSFRGEDVLRVDTTMDIPGSMGFGNAQVVISNTKRKSPADRDFTVVLYYRNYGSEEEGFSYAVPARLDEGQTSVTVDIPFASTGTQWTWDVAVFEGGRDIENVRLRPKNTAAFQWNYQVSVGECLQFIQGADETSVFVEENFEKLVDIVVADGDSQFINANNNQVPSVGNVINASKAHQDWRRYLPYKAVLLSASTIRELNASQPATEAIRNYVAAGGTLLVFSVSSAEAEGDLEQFLRLSGNQEQVVWNEERLPTPPWWEQSTDQYGSLAADERIDAGRELAAGGIAHDAALMGETWAAYKWNQHAVNASNLLWSLGLDFDEGGLEVDEYYSGAVSGYGAAAFTRIDTWIDDARYHLMSQVATDELRSRDYLGGKVMVSASPLSELSSDLILQSLAGSQRWSANTLAAKDADGNWFWRNLITAVGKPPVFTFCAIVALFGALLGPGLLFLTGRMARRSLMILLVPAVSLVATLAIVGYGVLHEGFGTYVRVTSVSVVDAETGIGFAWSRQNYFSGLPPREGFNLGLNTYARPVSAEDEQRYGVSDPRQGNLCRVTLADRQNWNAWLKPRQQQQLLIGHAVEGVPRIVALQREAERKLAITNVTESELPVVVVRGSEDDYYYAESVPAGATVVVEADDDRRVGASVARVMVDLKPEMPRAMQEASSLLEFGSGNGARVISRTYDSRDVIGRALEDYLSDRLDMPPLSFATIVRENEWIEIPVQGEQEQGLHIVVGTQTW